MKTIDFYVSVIDNYGDIGFAINMGLNLIEKNKELNIRFFSDDKNLFYKMIGKKNKSIIFYDLKNLENQTPSNTIYTFFDYRLPKDYLEKGDLGKNIIQFGYFLLHKEVDSLHMTKYKNNGDYITHFIPSLQKDAGGILIQKEKKDKIQFVNYLEEKCNINLKKIKEGKKIAIVFIYKDTLKEIIDIIENNQQYFFLVFDSGLNQINSQNMLLMPFLEINDFNNLLSISNLNIVRGENSICTSLSLGKITLWDIYKENNLAHMEKIEDYINFLNNFGDKNNFFDELRKFNTENKKEAFKNFLENSTKYTYLFKKLQDYIKNNCDIIKKIGDL